MRVQALPRQWQDAIRRDAEAPPPVSDPLPERRLARLLAAWIASGLVFLVLPGTVLGVWNLIGISGRHELQAISTAWIQAHGHAQFFGWVGSFMIGISLYTLPKFRGAVTRSVPIGWAMWGMWSAGVALRWYAGVAALAPAVFRASAALELTVAVLLVWQVTGPGKRGGGWVVPLFFGLAGLAGVLGWQMWLVLQPLNGAALPAAPDRLLITLAIWCFAYPVVIGYSAKFFPGLIGSAPPHKIGLAISTALASLAPVASVATAVWALRVFHATAGKPKTSGVYERYPAFARSAYAWLGVAAALGLWAARPGVLGASRHAFTVGFLATLIFALGPRILPSFVNSRELWSVPLMGAALWLLTAGCAIRVISEPLAYGDIVPAAWHALPLSAFLELTAVLLFAWNIARSIATPVPSWFGRKHVNDRMSVYWLIAAYPATRRLLVEAGLVTLGRVDRVPKSLTVHDAAEADGVPPERIVARLGDFFESRLPQRLRTSESIRSTNR